MFYVIVYDRQRSTSTSIEKFENDQSHLAFQKKLAHELAHAKNNTVEVALLQSDDYEILRRTHSRYFSNVRELVEDVRKAAGHRESA